MIGEHGEFSVKFEVAGNPVAELEVDLTKGERCKVPVRFSETVKNVALEASLVEQGADT